jgi:hypothetical protein
MRPVHHQRGLADPAQTVNGRYHPGGVRRIRAGRGERVELGQFSGPSGEAPHVVGELGGHRLGRGGRGGRGRRRGQVGITAQDPFVQVLELLTRLDAQLGHERGPPGAEYRQRLVLPAAAQQRQHQQGPGRFPQGVRVHQRAQLRQALAVPPQPQFALEQRLQRGQPLLLQLPGDVAQRIAPRVGQRRSPPQRQRLAEQDDRVRIVSRTRLRHQTPEPVQVDLVGIDLEQVSGGPGHHGHPLGTRPGSGAAGGRSPGRSCRRCAVATRPTASGPGAGPG